MTLNLPNTEKYAAQFPTLGSCAALISLHLVFSPNGAIILMGCEHRLLCTGNLTIERGRCRSLIWIQPQITDSHGEGTKDRPANEAEMEAEQPPFVAIHHFFGCGKGLVCGQFGMLRQYVFRHGVTVRGDDAGDDEKQ